MLAAPFEIDIRLVDGVRRVSVFGELDLASAPVLASRLGEVAAGPAAPIVVDLGGVSFIDARGLRALVEAHTRCNGSGGPGLKLVAAAPSTRRVFELTGLSGLLEAVDRGS